MATVKITNLHKSYGSVEVLKGINLFIEDGGFLVLVESFRLRQINPP